MNIADFIKEKKDIFNLKTKFPKLILNFLKKSYEESFDWVPIKKLSKRTQGIENETHRIEKDGNNFVQLEYREDLNKDIYKKLKFNPEELKAVIENFKVI